MPRRMSSEGFFWTLFSAGGVVAALLIPVHLFLFGLAFPLGLIDPPSHAKIAALIAHTRWHCDCWGYVLLTSSRDRFPTVTAKQRPPSKNLQTPTSGCITPEYCRNDAPRRNCVPAIRRTLWWRALRKPCAALMKPQ